MTNFTPWSKVTVEIYNLGRGQYSTGWSNLSVETTHISHG